MGKIEFSLSDDLPSATESTLISNGMTVIKRKSIAGGDAVWTVIGSLGCTAIGAVSAILIEAIKSKRLITLEIDGVKVTGLSKTVADEAIIKIVNESLNRSLSND